MRFCKNIFATLFAVTVLATSHTVRAANSIRFSDPQRRQLKAGKACKGEDPEIFEFQGKMWKSSKGCTGAASWLLESENNVDFCCQPYWTDGKGDSCASGTVADVCCDTCAEADCSCFDVANIVYKSSKNQKGVPYTCDMLKTKKMKVGSPEFDPEVCCKTYNGRKVEDVCCAACEEGTYDCDCVNDPFWIFDPSAVKTNDCDEVKFQIDNGNADICCADYGVGLVQEKCCAHCKRAADNSLYDDSCPVNTAV